MAAIICAEALSKRFGATQALDWVDIGVEAGRVLALLGPNGSGKTTLVRVLTTLPGVEQAVSSASTGAGTGSGPEARETLA